MGHKKGTNVPPQDLSMAEAIRLTEKAESTIRAWIKSCSIEAYQDRQGWWRINRDSLLHKAAEGAQKRPPRAPQLEGTASIPPQPTPLEKALSEALERERRINDELRGQVRQLEGELLKLTSELKALLTKETSGKLSRWFRAS
jgi:hypothetical protein